MKKELLKQFLFITLGVFLIALSYYFLFLPLDLVTGGVTGLSVILKKLITASWFKVSYVIYTLNGILLFVGLFTLGKDFFIRTVYGSLLLPTITYILELAHVSPSLLFEMDCSLFGLGEMTDISKIIIAVLLGGVMMGAGLGFCYKNNGSTGGMDVIQKIMSKFLHMPYSLTVYLTDGSLVLVSIFVFGFERTFYAFLIILIVGFVADFIEMGGRSRRTAYVISKNYEPIKDFIIKELVRGVTITDAKGGYSNADYKMLICTLSKKESYVLKDYIRQVDPNAFTFYVSAREVYGDGFE